MATTEKFTLSSGEVCSILAECASSHVLKLKFRDLSVEFEPQFKPPVTNQIHPVADMTDYQHLVNTAHALEADTVRLREDSLGQMFIEDPLRAEEMLSEGDLEDVDDESDGESFAE